jgi:hypothetical protein
MIKTFRSILICVCIICSRDNFSQVVTQTFVFTGSVQTVTFTGCVNQVTLDVSGAQGGSNTNSTVVGGMGGRAYGVLNVTAGDVLNIYVGGVNGYNGGGARGGAVNGSSCTLAGGGVGGGATDVRLNGTALVNRVIVAGGGGGAGGDRISNCGRGIRSCQPADRKLPAVLLALLPGLRS